MQLKMYVQLYFKNSFYITRIKDDSKCNLVTQNQSKIQS